LNFLLFDSWEDSFAAALDLRPSVMQFAWARQDQDLKGLFGRSHEAGCKLTYMAGAAPEAVRAAKAGADIIIAQGTEGGGHVGWMASMPLIPMVVDAVDAGSGSGRWRICRRAWACGCPRTRCLGRLLAFSGNCAIATAPQL
jgi:NAD(P)H-dependent flavin oxidoreductase YrpB (nitropropane dioxygenase family)